MAIDRNETNIRITATNATQEAFRSVGAGLKSLDASVLRVSSGFTVLGASIGAGLFVSFIKNSINAVAALDDMSEKTGLSVELLSKLEAVAIVGGHSLETITQSASKFSRSIGEAKSGTTEQIKAFEAIGISVDDLKSKSIDDLFVDVARKIATAEDHTLALAVSTKLLGRSAAEQMPFLKDLAEQGLGNARVTTAQAAAAEKAQKEFGKLTLVMRDFGATLASAVVPWISRMLEEMNQGIIVAGGFFEALRLFGTLPVASDASAGDLEATIKSLQKDLLGLLSARQDLSKIPGDYTATIRKIDSDIDDMVKRIEYVKLRQQAAAKREFQGPTLPAATTAIDAAKLNENAKKAQEALSKLFEQRAKQTAASESALAEERLRILDDFHGQGLISESEYWQTRFSIQKEALSKEVAAIDVELANRRKALGEQFTGADAGNDPKKWSADRINAEKEIEEALSRRAAAEIKVGSVGLENELAREKAVRASADAITEVAEKRLQIEGRLEEALSLSQERQNRAQRAQLTINDDQAGLAQLNRLEVSERLQLRFNEAQKQGAELTSRLAIEEERIQNALRVGAIGELEALKQTGAARAATVEQMKAISEELEVIASKPGFEKLKVQADQFKASMQKLNIEADLLKQKFETIGVDALSDALTDVITNTKSTSDAFRDMANAILQQIARIMATEFARGTVTGVSSLVGLFGAGGAANDPTGGVTTVGTVAKSASAKTVVINNSYQIDSRSDRTAIAAEIRASEKRTLAQVQDAERRGQLSFGGA